jgi:hypothetical protein
MGTQLAVHAKQTSFYMYPRWFVVGPTVCNIPLRLADPPNEIPQLVTTPQYYCGQPYGCAPDRLLPQNKSEILFQGLRPWQESHDAPLKPVPMSTHGLPLAGTTPMPHEQTVRSEKLSRPKKDKRTEHVLWVGNIDPTATLDELYHFFRQVDNGRLPPSESAIVSIHRIPKTRCALVNYKTSPALLDSAQRVHGMRLRNHPLAPRLVCRRKEQTWMVPASR